MLLSTFFRLFLGNNMTRLQFKHFAVFLALFLASTGNLSADIVTYDFFSFPQNRVTVRITFDAPAISSFSGWSVNGGTLLSSITHGGISGVSADFGLGFVNAVSGDLEVVTGPGIDTAGSLTGQELDFGSFGQLGNGGITFSDGNRLLNTSFTDSTDTIKVPFTANIPGEWTTSIPEPSILWLVGIGLLLGLSKRRRNLPLSSCYL